MPLRRSPPTTPTPNFTTEQIRPALNEKQKEMDSSEYSTSTLTTDGHESRNVTSRQKRKNNDEFDKFMSDIKNMFYEFQNKQDSKFEKLQGTINEIKQQNVELQNSI